MSKKSKRKGNLKYSLLLLLLIAILLVTSSYAWFTANRVVTVSQLQVNVQTQNGLQISADADVWKGTLSNEDLTGAAYEGCINQFPEILQAVSTAGENTTDGNLKLFYGVSAPSTDGSYSLTATQENGPTKGEEGKYIAFDIYLRADQDTTLQLQLANDDGDNPIGSFVTSPENRGLQNAARVAFIKQGHVGLDEDATTLQNQVNQDADKKVYIWEPNSTSHTDVAVQYALATYDETIADGTAYTTYGVKSAITSENAVAIKDAITGTNSTYFAETAPITTTEGQVVVSDVLTLDQGVTKLRVFMWIEGQDYDCENNASGSDAIFQLQFTIPEEPRV